MSYLKQKESKIYNPIGNIFVGFIRVKEKSCFKITALFLLLKYSNIAKFYVKLNKLKVNIRKNIIIVA